MSAIPEPLCEGVVTGPARPIRRADWIEALVVALLGAAVMTFIYSGATAEKGGVPGVDSFYHIRMAEMIPEHGFLETFPWLRFCYFSEEGDRFVSHHHGFQLLLLPFVTLARWTGSDALAGGRWAMCAFFGISLMLMHLILVTHGVRWRWVWMLAICILPAQFFGRHAFVRAPGPALAFMLLIILLIFRQAYARAGLAVAAFIHLYLGGVLYAPVLVATAALSFVLGDRDDRRELKPLIAWTAGGWCLGVLTHPYLGGMLEFLKLQVFGSGLSPDIEVGREWKPYEGLWWFAQMVGPLAISWGTVLALRLRSGPALDRREFTLFLLNAGFLLLTFKARRFIEYWPAMAFLSTGLMAQPLLERWHGVISHPKSSSARGLRLAVFPLAALALLCAWTLAPDRLAPFAAEWRLWALLAGALLVVPLSRVWRASANHLSRGRTTIMTTLGCVGTALIVGGLGATFAGDEAPRITVSVAGVVIALGALVATAWFLQSDAREPGGPVLLEVGLRKVAGAVGVAAIVLLVAAPPLLARRSEVSCKYDLPAIRSAMEFLAAHSEAGDVVFTDDWDVFPVYFYHNVHNHYIVGLDPKFTQHRRPALWERYVKITRGQTPSVLPNKLSKGERSRVRLEDIRDEFGARFVVTDGDHRKLARQLAAAPEFATLVYPAADYASCRGEPYLVFRIAESATSEAASAPQALPPVLTLDYLTPVSIEQGWGHYRINAAVGDGPLRLNGRRYETGLGTHAPSRLEFSIPAGYDSFEAVVGVDDGSDGDGSIVAVVELDGREVYRSPVLRNGSAVAVTVPLATAEVLVLRAEPTADGQRFDHVSWAAAKLTRGQSSERRSADPDVTQDPRRGPVPASLPSNSSL